MKIGAMDGVLAQPWESLFQVAAQIGFDGVELGVGGNYAETKLWDEAGRRELKALADKASVTIASICIHAYWQFSFANPDPAIRAQAAELAKSAAVIAGEIGALNLLLPVSSAEGASPEEANMRWIEGIRSCAKVAERNAVIYALENVGQPFARTGEQLASIVDAIDSPAVKVYFDPGNTPQPLADIAALGKRISQVHIKDPGGQYLGEGRVDLPGVIKALKGFNYDGWLILETPATDDPIGAGKRNLEYLRQLL